MECVREHTLCLPVKDWPFIYWPIPVKSGNPQGPTRLKDYLCNKENPFYTASEHELPFCCMFHMSSFKSLTSLSAIKSQIQGWYDLPLFYLWPRVYECALAHPRVYHFRVRQNPILRHLVHLVKPAILITKLF